MGGIKMKQRYDSYKPSGIDWIGEIPEHWQRTRIKYNISRSAAGVWGEDPKGDENDIICFRIADFDYSHGNICLDKIISRNIDTKQLIGRHANQGDLLIEKSGGGEVTPVGRVVMCNYSGDATYTNFIHGISLKDSIDSKFMLYYFNMLYSNKINLLFFNQTTGLQNLQVGDYLSQTIYIPNITEQKSIVFWLDKKCGEIDAAIEKVNKEIALLDELKQSEISRVVTRGLNPDVPLRPSGIDWIGDIPSQWRVIKLKYAMDLINGRAYLQPELQANGKYRILRVGNFFTNDAWYYSDMELEADKYCENGDLLYAWSASIGPYIWQDEKVIFHYHIWKVNLKPFMDLKYSYYLLDVLTNVKKNDMHGSAMQHLTMENMNNSTIVCPPLVEQEAIVLYLDKKCSEIDVLKAKLTSKLEALKKLRQSIISEVVTGKRKVV